MDVTRGQALAFRIAWQGLHREVADVRDLAVLELGVQDAVAGSHRVALAARLPEGAAVADPELVVVWAYRGAPHLLRRSEVAGLARRLFPRGDADAAARLGSTAARSLAGVGALAGFAAGAAALRAVVSREVSRAQASAAMTAALPAEYSYACGPCGSTHVFGSLFQLVGLAAGVRVLGGRPSRLAPLEDRHEVPVAAGDAEGLVRAYLRVHGPAAPADVAAFLDTTRSVVTGMWPRGLAEVRVDGRAAFVAEEDVAALRSAPDARGLVRLLPPMDPLLQGRDREVLVPDAARRKQVWKVIGNPGAVLAGGEIAGVWRPKVSGSRLDVAVTVFEPLPASARERVAAEAQRVAAARGLAQARVVFA